MLMWLLILGFKKIEFGISFFTKVVDTYVKFQMKLFLINLELYNSWYELKTEERSRPI
jgi:hypothetical protein